MYVVQVITLKKCPGFPYRTVRKQKLLMMKVKIKNIPNLYSLLVTKGHTYIQLTAAGLRQYA